MMSLIAGGSGRAGLLVAKAALLGTVCTTTALVLAACSAGSGGDARANAASPSNAMSYLGLHGEPPIGPLQLVTGPNRLHLPLDPYYLSAAEQLTINQAERAAEQACIHRYLPGLGLGSFGRVVLLSPTSEPLAYLTPSQAASYGYHDPAITALAAKDNTPLSGAALDDAEKVDLGTVPTFNGLAVPKGGCDATSSADVLHGISPSLIPTGNGSPATVPGVAKLINQRVILSDSRVKAVDTKWSACMARRGYYYTRPQFTASNPAWNRRNANGSYLNSITVAEIHTAVADAACRTAVNLYAVYWAVADAYQREWMAAPQNMAQAQAQQEADQVMRTRAEAILGG